MIRLEQAVAGACRVGQCRACARGVPMAVSALHGGRLEGRAFFRLKNLLRRMRVATAPTARSSRELPDRVERIEDRLVVLARTGSLSPRMRVSMWDHSWILFGHERLDRQRRARRPRPPAAPSAPRGPRRVVDAREGRHGLAQHPGVAAPQQPLQGSDRVAVAGGAEERGGVALDEPPVVVHERRDVVDACRCRSGASDRARAGRRACRSRSGAPGGARRIEIGPTDSQHSMNCRERRLVEVAQHRGGFTQRN